MKSLLLHKTLFPVLIALIFSTVAVGQVTISTAVPSSPATSCTNTTVTVSGLLGAANYAFSGAPFTVVGNTITININYLSGIIILPAIVPFSQTVNLGNLAPGTYTMTANGFLNSTFNSASAPLTIVVASCCPAIPSFTSSDTAACAGTNLAFTNTSVGAIGYEWYENNVLVSTATNHSAVMPAGPFSIKLVATDGNCSDSSVVSIGYWADPAIDLGNDTSICAGDSLQLNTPLFQLTYAWSTGETTSSIAVGTAGVVSVSVTGFNTCVGVDTLEILSLLPVPPLDFGPDQQICNASQATLDAGTGWTSYLWSTGATTQTIQAGPGTYSLIANPATGCPGKDTINISNYPQTPVNAMLDSAGCGFAEMSAAAGFSSYNWSNGATTSNATVQTAGPYVVTATDGFGCVQVDTVEATILETPVVDLGADTTICEGDSFMLDAFAPAVFYDWQDGSTAQTFTVTGAGTYTVTLTLITTNCSSSDTVEVATEVCVGIEEITANSAIQLYPNPSNGRVFLQTDNVEAGLYELTITDLAGRMLETKQVQLGVNPQELNMTQWSKGTYFVRLTKGETTSIAKVILE